MILLYYSIKRQKHAHLLSLRVRADKLTELTTSE